LKPESSVVARRVGGRDLKKEPRQVTGAKLLRNRVRTPSMKRYGWCAARAYHDFEGFWSIPKRGVMGSFHKGQHKKISRRTSRSFSSATNNRENADIFGTAIEES
jgi:hypothetical protein